MRAWGKPLLTGKKPENLLPNIINYFPYKELLCRVSIPRLPYQMQMSVQHKPILQSDQNLDKCSGFKHLWWWPTCGSCLTCDCWCWDDMDCQALFLSHGQTVGDFTEELRSSYSVLGTVVSTLQVLSDLIFWRTFWGRSLPVPSFWIQKIQAVNRGFTLCRHYSKCFKYTGFPYLILTHNPMRQKLFL